VLGQLSPDGCVFGRWGGSFGSRPSGVSGARPARVGPPLRSPVWVRGGVGVSPMVGAVDACDARGDDLPRGTTVTTCTTCGASLESTATTCPVCSAPVSAPDTTSGTASDPAASAPSPDPTSGTGSGPAW
jgi:hypothetical protein